jgi:NADPH:quinone reductase-like Zn-dependent oxidoreductase
MDAAFVFYRLKSIHFFKISLNKISMKAIFATKYGAPEVLQQKEIEMPVPKPNEVRIKTHTTTVTVADVRVRSFNVPASFWIPARIALGIFRPRKPILGVEISGEIDEVGNAVTKFKKGDLVFASTFPEFGGYAEYKCISENGALALKPKNISMEESAAIPIGGYTALNFLRKAELKAGTKNFNLRCIRQRRFLCRSNCQTLWRQYHSGVQR